MSAKLSIGAAMNNPQEFNQTVLYDEPMRQQLQLLAKKLVTGDFPVPKFSTHALINTAVLRMAKDIENGATISGVQIKSWLKMYPDHRGVGLGGKQQTRFVRLSSEARAGMETIGAYLKNNFAPRTIPNLFTNRGLLNGRLICAFAVYYSLEK